MGSTWVAEVLCSRFLCPRIISWTHGQTKRLAHPTNSCRKRPIDEINSRVRTLGEGTSGKRAVPGMRRTFYLDPPRPRINPWSIEMQTAVAEAAVEFAGLL